MAKARTKRSASARVLRAFAVIGHLLGRLLVREATASEPSPSVVVPNEFESIPGNDKMAINGGAWYTQVYFSSQFASASGSMFINGVRFRSDENNGSLPFDATFSYVLLQLGAFPLLYSRAEFNRVAAEISTDGMLKTLIPDAMFVFSHENVRLTGTSSTSPSVPSPFEVGIPFDTPFYYNPRAGGLIMLLLVGNRTVAGATTLDFDFPASQTPAGWFSYRGNDSLPGTIIAEFAVQPVPRPIISRIDMIDGSLQIDFGFSADLVGRVTQFQLEGSDAVSGTFRAETNVVMTSTSTNAMQATTLISSTNRFFRIRLN